ncbi:MAG TPA: SdrD B-like domain-containing protein, partial [Smithellaceae bacterium]|nr:SdrD B-like domain-containing protein [Smithellaceae bacterium]
MKGMDILKTTAAFLLALVLVSCGSGGDTVATAPGISGHITIGGTYFAGVTVTLSGTASATTTTNSSGYYSFTGLANGDYVVTPTRTGCTFTPTSSPTLTYSGTDITQNFTAVITPAIAAGYSHSLALKSDGTVWAWGNNGNGQLGIGTITNSYIPAQVSGLTDVIAIAAGGHHSLAIKANGTVWAWGYNGYGQLGIGTTTNSLTPVQVSNLSGITAIAAGGNHSLALTSSGGVRAWGLNSY